MREETAKLIVFEGIDGSGKSTHARLLAEHLASSRPVILTCEPTRDTEMGKFIRRILAGEIPAPTGDALALLFEADRVAHKHWIREQMSKGVTVITDRYELSTIAYQATWLPSDPDEMKRELGRKRALLGRIHRHYALVPDLTFVMNIPVEEAIRRLGDRPVRDLYEHSAALRSAAVFYKNQSDGPGVVYVDGRAPQDKVQDAVRREAGNLWATW